MSGVWQSSYLSSNFWSVWVTYRSMQWVVFVLSNGCLSCMAKLLTLDITRKLFNQFSIPAMLTGTIDVIMVYTTFTEIDPAWGSQGKRTSRPLDFIFSHNFQLIRMKFNMVSKQFKLINLVQLLSEIYLNKGINCCFTYSVKNWLDDRWY